jgi:RND family efflux transporter MFP subunit
VPGSSPAGSGPSRNPIVRWVAAILILAAIGAGYWYETRPRPASPDHAAPVHASAPPAVTVSHPITRRIVDWYEYTGQFSAVDQVDVRARVSGYLDEIHFVDGQMVRQGDLLFVIDPRPFEADLRQAQATLERDKAQVVRANLDLPRYAELARKNFATQQQYEAARATAEAAAATARGDEAALAQARLNLGFTRSTAPISGRIGRHLVGVGNLVVGGAVPGITLLTTIVSLDPIQFYFDMSEADFLAFQRAVARGELKSALSGSVRVFLNLEDEKTWPHEGRLDFVNNQIDVGSGTIRARAAFPNPKLLITPGQFGRVRVPASAPHDAILIPDSAIVSDQSRKIVMTVRPDGTVVPRAIEPGPAAFGLRIVRSGLTSADEIIIDGLPRARPGAKVKPEPGKIVPAEEP